MRKLAAIISTDLRRELSSPAILISFLILPLIFTAAVSSGLSAVIQDGAETARPLVVVQSDSGRLGAALIDLLRMRGVDLQVSDTYTDQDRRLMIPPDMTARLQNGQPVTLTLCQPTAPGSADQRVRQAIVSAQTQLSALVRIARAAADEAQANGVIADPQTKQAFFDQFLDSLLQTARDPTLRVEVNQTSDDRDAARSMAGVEQASAGQLVTWVQITLLGACGLLLGERTSGALQRLMVLPTTSATILGGKLIARLLMGLLQMTILFVSGAVLFRVGWNEEPEVVALISIALVLAILGLALLAATFVKTDSQATAVINGLGMGTAALGGAWWPLEITPPLYQTLVQILPTTWAMRAYTRVLTGSVTVMDVLPEVGVLLGFAVVFFSLGVWRFRSY